MKQPDSLQKQLFIPILSCVGLVYLAWQMVQDGTADGGSMTVSMWAAVGLMLVGACFSAFTGWKRYQLYQKTAAELPKEPEELPQVEKITVVPSGDLVDGADGFARLIIGNRNLPKQFKKATYPATFESFCCQVDNLLPFLTNEEEMKQLAELILERLEANWKEEKEHIPNFTDQVLVSVYLVPALNYTREYEAEEFARIFHAAWKAHYPKSPFVIGTYEEIAQGFEKKFGCFITTAVCQSQGKPDDCYELTRFRAFRDGWLAQQPEGQDLIARYYDIAPSIVNIINHQGNADTVYQQIKKTYLDPCLAAIERGDNQDCLVRYRTMMENLSLQYGV